MLPGACRWQGVQRMSSTRRGCWLPHSTVAMVVAALLVPATRPPQQVVIGMWFLMAQLCVTRTSRAGYVAHVVRAASKPNGKALMQCSACLEEWYCSATCQRKHWKVHKKECRIMY
jgi:hypothetical protein